MPYIAYIYVKNIDTDIDDKTDKKTSIAIYRLLQVLRNFLPLRSVHILLYNFIGFFVLGECCLLFANNVFMATNDLYIV